MNKSTVHLPHSTPEEASTLLFVFNSVYPISAGSKKFLTENTYPIKIRKGKKLHKSGEICDMIYFVNKGAVRGYVKDGNKEITTWITVENELVASIHSFILPRSVKNENSLLRKFIDAASKLQSRKEMLTGHNENMVNIYYQDLLIPLLKVKSNSAREQSLMGTSSSGKGFGQIDIAVSDFDGVPKSIFEGFFLKGLQTSVIDTHFDKTIQNYDANGLSEKFMGVYCKAENFSTLALKYSDYISSLAVNKITNIEILSSSNVSHYYVQGSEIKVLRTDYLRS